MLESEVPVLIENTAGGDNAVARRFDALAMLWEAFGGYDGPVELGFCFDTCHAHAAGEDLSDAVERAVAITGRLDLLHANDSRDPAGTGADRHERLGAGQIEPDALRGMIRAGGAKGAPIVVETPGRDGAGGSGVRAGGAGVGGARSEPPEGSWGCSAVAGGSKGGCGRRASVVLSLGRPF